MTLSPSDSQTLLAILLADPSRISEVSSPLPAALAQEIVTTLKQEADRHWLIDPHRSLQLAACIVQIGQARRDLAQIGLGLMARGDALRQLGQAREAWDTLDEAGRAFRAADDEVGWARTRIGRLHVSMEVQAVEEALADAAIAESVFRAANEEEMLLRLLLNKGILYNYQGVHHQALELFERCWQSVDSLGDRGEMYCGVLHLNQGYAFRYLGQLDNAHDAYIRAIAAFQARGEHRVALTAQHNIADLLSIQGHYRHALRSLHQIEQQIKPEWIKELTECLIDMVFCYLAVNNFEEARERALDVVAIYRAIQADFFLAQALLYLGIAEAKLEHPLAATDAFHKAELIFEATDARSWLALTQLHRGQLALYTREADSALALATEAHHILAREGRQLDAARALHVIAQAHLMLNKTINARMMAEKLLQETRACHALDLQYSAHLILGQIAERERREWYARWHYRAATSVMERLRRQLTFTTYPLFMADKEEALQRLIRLTLQRGKTHSALETLEHVKGHRWLDRLLRPESWRWSAEDEASQALLAELEQLRAQYQLLRYHQEQRHAPNERAIQEVPSEEMADLRRCERQIRLLTERLFLEQNPTQPIRHAPITVERLAQHLDDDSALIEYFDDSIQLWAFVLHRGQLRTCPLPITRDDVKQLQQKMRDNLRRVRVIGAHGQAARALSRQFRQLAARLHAGLLAPLALDPSISRLLIVPYGVLHTVPFHLLHDGERWEIDRRETVLLPAASLLLRERPRGEPRGAHVFAYSRQEVLHHTVEEARRVAALLETSPFCEEEATRSRLLDSEPAQLLHIAAHSEFRLDQPDLSAIYLHDGPLYSQELMQQRLSYELITLSGCETGMAHIAPGDDPLGLGHMLLYAGARALIVSLWRVEDEHTATLMTSLYRSLKGGASKAAALRNAQLQLIQQRPDLHPAFWGAFALVGDPAPLST